MIVDERIEAWLRDRAPAEGIMREMQERGEAGGFPIVGPLVGRLLSQLARCVGARSVFEMGSGFGYSTAWFAQAVGPDGRVVHTEGSEALSYEARMWLERLGLAGGVDFRVGDALDQLRGDGGTYDVVFCDVDKQQYPDAWAVARTRVRKGGLVLFDNALWGGRVADPAEDDEATHGVRSYLASAYADPGFLTSVVPLRDGVGVSLRL